MSDAVSTDAGRPARSLLATHYFLYFGVVGIYLPFFNLYCDHIGLSGWQIGNLSAVRSVVTILFSLFWSLLADRYQARRPIYILCNIGSAAAWALFLFTAHYGWMLVIMVGHTIFYAPIIAFLEAFAVQLLGSDKKRYGRLRAWGSVAFIATVLVLGRVIDAYGIRIILSLILAGSWVQALVALGFPKPGGARRPLSSLAWRRLVTPRSVLFWVCAFLMLLSHGAYYGFFSIHLAHLGHPPLFIGLCWALASCAEIVVMIYSERLFRKWSYQTVLLIAFGAAVLRWAGLWASVSVAALVLLQLTHALTYGAFHMASILYVDAMAPEENKTLAQAVNNAVTYGLGLMVGFLLSGALYEPIGARNLFLISAGIAALGGLLFAFARRFEPRDGQ